MNSDGNSLSRVTGANKKVLVLYFALSLEQNIIRGNMNILMKAHFLALLNIQTNIINFKEDDLGSRFLQILNLLLVASNFMKSWISFL